MSSYPCGLCNGSACERCVNVQRMCENNPMCKSELPFLQVYGDNGSQHCPQWVPAWWNPLNNVPVGYMHDWTVWHDLQHFPNKKCWALCTFGIPQWRDMKLWLCGYWRQGNQSYCVLLHTAKIRQVELLNHFIDSRQYLLDTHTKRF
jgi:hypothetical protein